METSLIFLICCVATTQIVRLWLKGGLFASIRNWLEVKDFPFISKHLLCDVCVPVSVGAMITAPLLYMTLPMTSFLVYVVPTSFAVSWVAWWLNSVTIPGSSLDDSDDSKPEN